MPRRTHIVERSAPNRAEPSHITGCGVLRRRLRDSDFESLLSRPVARDLNQPEDMCLRVPLELEEAFRDSRPNEFVWTPWEAGHIILG